MSTQPVERQVRECGDEDPTAGRGPGQRGWYEWIAPQVAGQSVLDAGCGLGYGLDILGRFAQDARGQDLDPRLASPRITIAPLQSFPDKSFDVVVSIDVIEHVDDDHGFVGQLTRLARSRVFITTPNWTAGRCTWPYHVREYTPEQLRGLCEQAGRCRMSKGTPDGTEVYPIVHPTANDWLNRSRVAAGLGPLTRVLNNLLPKPARIHSHLCAVIDVRS